MELLPSGDRIRRKRLPAIPTAEKILIFLDVFYDCYLSFAERSNRELVHATRWSTSPAQRHRGSRDEALAETVQTIRGRDHRRSEHAINVSANNCWSALTAVGRHDPNDPCLIIPEARGAEMWPHLLRTISCGVFVHGGR